MGMPRPRPVAVLSLAAVACATLLLALFFAGFPATEVPSLEHPRQVKYGLTLKNKTNTLIGPGELWVYAPVPETAFQTSAAVTASLPFQIHTDLPGNQILNISIDALPPFATRVVHITAPLTLYDPARKVTVNNTQIYLAPEPFIESNHPDIVRLAGELKQSSPGRTAQRIYEWVSTRITSSGYTTHRLGAHHTLTARKGDCTEFTDLFTALCRAAGIPARGMGGYICPGNCVFRPSEYHNWAEVRIDSTWVVADCQKKVFSRNAAQYIAVNIISDHAAPAMKGYQRFRYQGPGGRGISVRMNR